MIVVTSRDREGAEKTKHHSHLPFNAQDGGVGSLMDIMQLTA